MSEGSKQTAGRWTSPRTGGDHGRGLGHQSRAYLRPQVVRYLISGGRKPGDAHRERTVPASNGPGESLSLLTGILMWKCDLDVSQ